MVTVKYKAGCALFVGEHVGIKEEDGLVYPIGKQTLKDAVERLLDDNSRPFVEGPDIGQVHHSCKEGELVSVVVSSQAQWTFTYAPPGEETYVTWGDTGTTTNTISTEHTTGSYTWWVTWSDGTTV